MTTANEPSTPMRRRPVSETLLESLRGVLVGGNPIIVWLDKDGHYTALVDELLAEPDERLDLGAPLLAYRGSYLQLMQELAPLTDGVDPKPLIVHVPGVNQDGIKDTPLLELNESGYQYRKALTTLIHEAAAGRVTADEVDDFLRAHEEDGNEALTLEAADAWMDERMAMADDTARLVLRGFEPAALIQALNENRAVVRELGGQPGPALDHYFGARLGLPTAWPSAERRAWVRTQTARYADLAAQWAMSVEYVHDLDRSRGRKRALKAPVLNAAEELATPLVAACRETAERLRASARDFYTGVADDFEDRLEDERDEGKPEELGRIDTFRFEEDRLLQAALRAVREQRWSQAAEWAQQRLDGKSVWLSVDPNRRKAWRLISTAASLGQAIEASPLSFADTQSLAEATQRYTEIGAPIDGLHRELEQQAASALVDLPHTKLVRGALSTARARWRQWAETGAQEWSTLCERAGALPSPDMQQRAVFVEVVKPMLDEGDKVALFLVDAMRYEMAQQLIELIGQHAATSVHLAPRLAELPTITAVGMNALAHVGAGATATGRLRPKLDKKRRRFLGFETGGFTLKDPPSRKKSYKRAAQGVKWIDRAKLGDDPSSLKTKISQAQLVVVHSVAIDNAGEHGHGPLVFAQELRELHKAWELLRAADVRRFVITSDHGFLLRRPGDHGDVLDFGKTYDATARHALYPSPTVDELRLALTLRSLGYEGADEALILPRGLDVFEVAKDRDFVHGGNSPQERVIPVLTIRHKHLAGGEDQHYAIEILKETVGSGAHSNTHTIEAKVTPQRGQTSLTLGRDPVPLQLRVLNADGVMIEILDSRGAASDSGQIAAPVREPFTLRFRLSSASEQRVRVELVSASAKRVTPTTSTSRFGALARPVESAKPPEPEPAPTSTQPEDTPEPEPTSAAASWLDEIADEGDRRVLAHIAEHGSIAESDLAQLLGHQRKVRRFARKFDEYRQQAPFLMDQTHTGHGKVYRKISDK